MVLSDGTIEMMIKRKTIIYRSKRPPAIQPASLDLRLGNYFLDININHTPVIDMQKEIKYRETYIEDSDFYMLMPGEFVLAHTDEYIGLPTDICAKVDGRSSIGRQGLFIQNAGFVDPNFEGQITLELYNANKVPIKLRPGHRICQLVFYRMDLPANNPYQGKYQGQTKAQGSLKHLDQEIVNLK